MEVRFVFKMLLHWVWFMSVKRPTEEIPALLIRTSIPPVVAMVLSITFCTKEYWLISPEKARQEQPVSWIIDLTWLSISVLL